VIIAIQQFVRNPMPLTRELPEWFRAHWWEFASITNRFNNAKIDGLLEGSPGWASAAGGILFCIPLVLALWPLVRRGQQSEWRRSATVLCALLWLCPTAVLLTMAAFKVQFDIRYICYCIVPYYMLVAVGTREVRPTPLQTAWVAGLIALSIIGLRAN